MKSLSLTGERGLTTGPFELTKTGMIAKGEPTLEQWKQAGSFFQDAEGAVHWWIGDWLLMGADKYEHGQYEAAIESLPFERDTLRSAKWVAGQIESVRRRTLLSWSHHREVAALPEPDQNYWLNQAEENEWSRNELRKAIKDRAKLLAIEKSKTAAKNLAGDPENYHVFHGDSFKLASAIPDESCALIFTDPPYDRASLPMFSQLAELAERILVDGGSLITYCGQYVLDEVIESLQGDGMRFFWITCCLHTGDTAQMREYGIKVRWKLMLWFVKGDFRRDRETWVDDLVESQQEKDAHPWQQSVVEASYYIQRLTSEGELIVDPFCGGGTTAVAAKQLERLWWTADIEAKHVATARGRLRDTTPPTPAGYGVGRMSMTTQTTEQVDGRAAKGRLVSLCPHASLSAHRGKKPTSWRQVATSNPEHTEVDE